MIPNYPIATQIGVVQPWEKWKDKQQGTLELLG